MEAKELIIVIPAYEPDHLLPELIDKLNEYFHGHKMIVVNDGSLNKEELFKEIVPISALKGRNVNELLEN